MQTQHWHCFLFYPPASLFVREILLFTGKSLADFYVVIVVESKGLLLPFLMSISFSAIFRNREWMLVPDLADTSMYGYLFF
jgi:hypothetical protein